MGLDIIEFYMAVEEEFDISLPSELVEEARTFGEVYVLVCNQLAIDPTADDAPPNAAGWTPKIVYNRMRLLLAKVMKIPVEEIHFDSRLMEDLGIG